MKRAHRGSPIFLTLLSCFFLLLPRHVAAASKLLPLASRDRTVEAGETAMLSVQVVDEAGRPRKGVGVKFRIVLTPMMADGAGISGSAVSTDSKGIARVKLTTSSPGTYQVTATNRALLGSPIVFTVRAKPSKHPAPPSRVEVPSVPPPSIPMPQTQLPSPVLPRITVAPNPAPALVVAKGVRENADPNEPKTLILYAPFRKWLAGSPEKVPVKFKIFDAEGHLLAGNFLVSVEGDGLLVEGKDADERREGLQIRPVGGVGEVKVRAGAETGEGSLVARVVATGKGEEGGGTLEAKLGFALEMGEAVGVEAEPREVHGRAGEVVAIKTYLVDRHGNRRGVEGRIGVTGEWGVVKGEGVELRRAGRHEAWVRAEGFEARVPVEVEAGEAVKVEVIMLGEARVGGEAQIVGKVTDEYGNLVSRGEVIFWAEGEGWGVHPSRVRAGGDGKYYAVVQVGRGPQGVVGARAGRVRGEARIEAAPGPVATLRLVPNRLAVQAGGYAELMVETAGLFGGVPRPERVEVRADRGSTHAGWLDIIAGKGKVIYKAPEEVGNDTLSVRSGKLQVAAVITVVAGDPARIELSPAAGAQGEAGKPQVPAGGQMPIQVKVLDAFGNPLEATEVSFGASRGRFEGARRRQNALDASAGAIYEAPKEAGPVLLWAQAGKARGDLRLEVVPGELVALRVHPSQLTLRAGEEHVFEAYGKDRYGNEGPVKVDWRAEMIGQMDRETGLFRVRRTGRGRVVAQAGSLSAQAQVTVEPGPPVDIEVRAGEAKVGEPLSVSAVVRDAFGNPVGGVPVVCQASAEDYEFEPLRTLTDDEGVAEFLIQMPPRLGKVSIEVTSPHIPQRASAD